MDLWTRLNAGFRRYSGFETHTVHRGLVDPATGEFSTDTIHGLIAARVPDGQPLAALDAGCGYGGTMLALHTRLGGTWHGVTISPRQHSRGERLIRERGLGHAISIALASYDDPLPGTYSLIYGIESLIHASEPARTIANLTRALTPGGRLIVIDDVPAEQVPDWAAADLAGFKRFWRCPVMPTAAGWSRLIEASGCVVEEVIDLTPQMRPRAAAEIEQALAEVGARRRVRDLLGWRRVGEAETGGLLLERLTRARAVLHVMIVARLPPAP